MPKTNDKVSYSLVKEKYVKYTLTSCKPERPC